MQRESTVRAVAVQPRWGVADFATAARFRGWMRAQLEAARPHLHPDHSNLVVLTELNGLPLLLRGAALAARAGSFQRAAALLFLHHLPAALPILLREGVSPVRALGLACADQGARLYLDTCRALAREYGVWLLCGTLPLPHYRLAGGQLRRVGSGLYNTAVLLDPQGELVGCTDKVHLTPDEEVGGLDLTPGALEDVRVYATPAGRLGVATSLDAFRADVVGRLAAAGCTVLLQPDANGGAWTGPEQIPPEGSAPAPGWQPRPQPQAWLESSWAVTQRGDIPYAVNPMVVGALLDLHFDGQSAICGPAAEAPVRRSYQGTAPRPGFLALLPWDGEDRYRTGVLSADLHLTALEGTAVEGKVTGALSGPTPTERALAAQLRGEARFTPSPLLRLSGSWPLLVLGVAALTGLLTRLPKGRRRGTAG